MLAGEGESAVGPRIQLWEAGIVFQALPRRTTMDEVRHTPRYGLSVSHLADFSSFRRREPWRKSGQCLGLLSHTKQIRCPAMTRLCWPCVGCVL